MVLMVPQVRKGLKVLKVLRDQRAHEDRLVHKDQKAIVGRQAQKETKETKTIKVKRETRAIRGPKARMAWKVVQGLQAPQGPIGACNSPALLTTKLDKNADIDMLNKYGILRLKRNHYPIQGDLTKVINYEDQREIFLSKKEDGKWNKR